VAALARKVIDELRVLRRLIVASESCETASVVAGTVQKLMPDLDRCSDRVVISVKGQTRAAIRASDLEKCLEVVLTNAAEAMEGRGAQPLEITIEGRPPFVTVEITDHGCGIPAENRNRIFEPGFTTKPGDRGRGLDIVCRKISEYGGKAEVLWTEVGGGTTIQLKLKAAAGTFVSEPGTDTSEEELADAQARDAGR
jgi:C4-dicarboxylate-specific signal transduction histidine kinase